VNGYVLKIQETQTLEGHSDSVVLIAIAPDDRTIASGSDDGTVRLWDLATGENLVTFRDHSEAVNAVSISRDGKFLASGGNDKTIRLWRLSTRRLVATKKVESYILSLAFSPNGNTLVVGQMGSMTSWDIPSLKEHRPKYTDIDLFDFWSVAFSPDGKILSAGGYNSYEDGVIGLWKVKTGHVESILIQGKYETVHSLVFPRTAGCWLRREGLGNGLSFETRTGTKSDSNCPVNLWAATPWPFPPTAACWLEQGTERFICGA
jgi:WD40 repeat protein